MQDDTHSFVVRIWHEALDSEGHIAVWRGLVDHVGSGERRHFEDLGQLLGFIQSRAQLDENESSPPNPAPLPGKRG